MGQDKFDTKFDQEVLLNFRLQLDAVGYAIGVFLLPFIAIRSISDLWRYWWLFIPAVILSLAVYLTARGLKKSSYVKKPLNLTGSN